VSSHHHRPARAVLAAGLLAAVLAGPAAGAEGRGGGVVVFDGPAPPPDALARILWPAPAAATPAVRTRSIRLLDQEPSAGSATAGGPEAFAFLIRFRLDSAEILPESLAYLDSVGAMLGLPEAEGRRVAIVGHADATGPEEYNQSLSERRAVAVAAYLRQRHNVGPDRLAADGRGEREPLPGLDPAAPRNRRVEFRAADEG
jgi:OOP family OmpA-OmpF porin